VDDSNDTNAIRLSINADLAKSFSLSAQQNAYPLVKRVVLSAEALANSSETAVVRSLGALQDIQVRLTTEPEFIQPEEWLIDRLEAGQSTKLQERPLYPNKDMLVGLTEQQTVVVTIAVSYTQADGTASHVSDRTEVSFLPADYWGGESRQPELLAAFVQPNTHVVETLTSKVSQLLRTEGKGSEVDGYQSNTRERPFLFGSALWAVIFNERFTYLSPPQGWARQGQRIRPATDILQYKTAACLDTSVLFASCLENMGLNPVIALTREHSFAGFWLIDENFPVLTSDDPIDLRKRIDSADLIMFETTLVTNDKPITFNQSIDHAKQLLTEEKESEFVMLIDIKHARSRKIKPLSTIEQQTLAGVEVVNDGVEVRIGSVPTLPPVRADERIVDETPETRIDMWQRKLLDLTKRNPLLNVKSSALKLFCPDLGELEDMLAAGDSFNFISAEDSGLDDEQRSNEAFLLSSGNDLHRAFAVDHLARKRIIVNDAKKRMENKLVELFRKAKNDLEEGGSNTLYLAIGMLRWRETPDSDRSFRAPLILLPIKLERRSAQAKVTMKQLPDEDPIFNLTLLEMLQTDYDINLDNLRADLPEDESGVDVVGIWNIVRDAIKEQKGFIVEESIVLGSFSFAKYLMWKDLRDRTDVLKKSPFVEHLIDRPTASYQQQSEFIERSEVDTRISPEEFFAPLNCDSSQMVAVAASAKPQDFVLEGPPGTGKSETIANIISHNLALGRKVLFVAEKMAALQVVYRRMEKIGLAHLCLELHSNKANKKSVLDQLNGAWSKRETASQSEWVQRAQALGELRKHLNKYVEVLHKKSTLGFSAREAIARVIRYQQEHPLRLDWPRELTQAPVQTEADVARFLTLADEMGVAYREVAELDPAVFSPIAQTDWSNEWRGVAVTLANKLSIAATQLDETSKALVEVIGVPLEFVTGEQSLRLSQLAELCDLAMRGNVDFALSTGGRAKIAALNEAAKLQNDLFRDVEAFGHGLTWSKLNDLEWEEWISRRNAATGLFGFIKRLTLRRAMVKGGLEKVNDLSILELALAARTTLGKLESVAQPVNGTPVWSGVDTDPEHLSRCLIEAKQAFKLLNTVVAAFPDASVAVPALRRHLVGSRDFLSDGSQLVAAAKRLAKARKTFLHFFNQAKEQRIAVPLTNALPKVASEFQIIADNSEKLGRWCRWLQLKSQSHQLGLQALAQALESRIVQPDDCESNALTALSEWLAPILIDQSPTLVRFAGANHEAMIDRFRELDIEVSSTAAQYIAAKTAGLVPDRNAPETPPEYGVLARELTKKTRHKPVRALVTEMGQSLTNLTPCFMMSPLSVAQFLPADFSLFDLVVFDEASQITTWDAVGAIARGMNVIVVGDPKQMPPSNNFGRKDDDDSDEGDLESILDQALAARLPHLRLTGHYRSRHETLIAFSNSHYYDNSLTTFPSAETKQSAVNLRRVQGVYAKGRGQTNPIEAQAVVDEVVRRLAGMLNGLPTLSIGIVAINSNQQRMVEDFMDDARRKNPELEPFFIATDAYDPIFVKNLESVQGDERDIIMLSLTYGPTELGGQTMSMNFGPLNKQGGERRLNVAVTRATTEVIVFSSFDSSMVDLSRTQATAIEHLKNYLEFAERGPIALTEYSTANHGVDQFDSDFEQAVAMALRAKGWKVQTQVGVSKFRVDMGIIHPDYPGEYLAGVECDGATYHGSPSARDRDRVRQAILENLGWRIVRLWSTDYFQDPGYAMGKLHERLETALTVDRAQKKRLAEETKPIESVSPTASLSPSDSDAPIDLDAFTSKIREDPEDQEELGLLRAANAASLGTAKDVGAPTKMGEQPETVSLAEGVLADLPVYHKDLYFHDDHRSNLSRLAKAVLERKNGITLHELTQDVASLHGLARSSRKQRQYLRQVIKGWAGFWREGEAKTTVWLSPDDVCDEIFWRGLFAFGVERDWKDLCHQEQIGFTRAALQARPDDPVEWMFEALEMRRRHEATTQEFRQWVERVDAKQT
jgi:very-short-patch-repair endonuclease